jgi:carbamate kinase
MRIVAALGGTALLRRGEPLETEVQRRSVARAVEAIAPLGREHELVVTHGNGTQVSPLALRESASRDLGPYPLDVLGAASEGVIGYLLAQELRNALPERPVAALLTQVVVDEADPAFREPTKPIGPVYSESEARSLAAERGWKIARDDTGWRRVVPSPEPLDIVEREAVKLLVDAGVLVVSTGGSGIPVVAEPNGALHGVEAVIDKNLAAALLGALLGADALLLLTDVEAVFRGFGTSRARPIRKATPAALRREHLAAGSMGPKVEAACRFAERTGGRAFIGALDDASSLVREETGTVVEAAELLAHEPLTSGGDERDRLGEEHSHRVAESERLSIGRTVHLDT